MNWFNILKLRGDVNISTDHHPMYYETGHPQFKYVAGQYMPEHPRPHLSHSVNVYLGGVRRILEIKYQMEHGRKPTERELEEAVKETIIHEAGHAAHHHIEPDRFTMENMESSTPKDAFEEELIAFTVQYKDRIYEIYQSLSQHPNAAMEAKIFAPAIKWAEKVVPNDYNYRRLFGNKWGMDLVYAARNKVLLLYLQSVKTSSDLGVFTDLTMSQVPKSKKEAVEMFGPKNEEFARSLRLPAVKRSW